MIIPARMLMCDKVTHKKLIDSSPLFLQKRFKNIFTKWLTEIMVGAILVLRYIQQIFLYIRSQYGKNEIYKSLLLLKTTQSFQ